MRAWMVFQLALVLALVGPAQPVEAQDNPLIERGTNQYEELRFEEALQTLSAALVRAGNTNAQKATIYRLLAFTYLALRREEEAAGAYRYLLALNPDFVPGEEVAPRTRNFFEGVREQWESEGRPGSTPPPPVTIQHRSPPEAERGESVALEATVEDPAGRVAELVLAYRQGSDAVFNRLNTTLEGATFGAIIPGDDVAPPLVEYYFEALDATGLPLAARGDVAAPLRIAVPEAGDNILEQWWFWTVIGVVVVGGAVAGIVIADQLSNQGPSTGTLVVTIE